MMTDFQAYDGNGWIEADVCIAGAGAAGITIARKLIGKSLKLVLLEGGGLDYEDDSQIIYSGINIGHPYFDLDVTRLRCFGGTTNHWAGECAPLDVIDFKPRAWVPYSGWPIDRATLDDWYAEAHEVIGLGRYDYDHLALAPHRGAYLELADGKLRHKVWRYNEPTTRFGETYHSALQQAGNIEVWYHANVIGVDVEPNGSRVNAFQISTMGGKTAKVHAKAYVLALGGLENPRILLNANDLNPAGLGNDHDLVGRFFADHLNGVAGEIAVSSSGWEDAYDFFRIDSIRGKTKVRISPEAQAARELLNTAASWGEKPTARNKSAGYRALRQIRDDIRHGKFPADLGRRAVDIATDLDGIWHGLVEHYLDSHVYIEVEAEQAPNPDSRVRLADERDALGMRRIELDWRLSPIDRESIKGLVQLIGEEVGRLGIGRAALAEWLQDSDDVWPDHQLGGNHHMGTTRMADQPSRGVVDSNSKVFGIDNLFVAGSSVFPTSGCANPTLTIVALALRLAVHIDERVIRQT